jgi:hypothetical protein
LTRLVPVPKGYTAAAWGHEGRVDHPVKPKSPEPISGGVGRWNPASVHEFPPFGFVNRLLKGKSLENGRCCEVRKGCTGELELRDQRRVLDESLVVFGPCR